MKRCAASGVVLILAALVCQPALATQLIASSFFDGLIYHLDEAGNKTKLPYDLDSRSRPNGVAIDAAGNVFVAVNGGVDHIRRIRPDGENDVVYAFDSNYDNPEGLAFGPDGNLYTAGTIGSRGVDVPNAVYRITPDGQGGLFATAGVQENLGLAIDRSGNVYVTDFGIANNDFWGEVWRITPEGQSTRLARFQARAFAVAIAPDGESLLVADQRYNRILTLSLDGVVGHFANIPGPQSLAVDGAGNVYVGQNDRISRIAPDGTQHLIATGFREVRGIAIYPGVPEPSSGLLLLVSSCLVGLHRRR